MLFRGAIVRYAQVARNPPSLQQIIWGPLSFVAWLSREMPMSLETGPSCLAYVAYFGLALALARIAAGLPFVLLSPDGTSLSERRALVSEPR